MIASSSTQMRGYPFNHHSNNSVISRSPISCPPGYTRYSTCVTPALFARFAACSTPAGPRMASLSPVENQPRTFLFPSPLAKTPPCSTANAV